MIVALLLADLLSDDFGAGCSLENEADAQSRYLKKCLILYCFIRNVNPPLIISDRSNERNCHCLFR